jgi:hypothetical protein
MSKSSEMLGGVRFYLSNADLFKIDGLLHIEKVFEDIYFWSAV